MKFGFVAVALCITSIGFASEASAQKSKTHSADGKTLVYVVTVMRHGVRSPTDKSSQYDRFSNSAWPIWSVSPGELTPHGYEVVRLRGGYERQLLSDEHLLASEGCADVNSVYFHADSDQRTRETANALAEGMFPGCKPRMQRLEEGQDDPVFHSPSTAISLADKVRGVAAVAGRIGGSPAQIADAYKVELKMLDDVLSTCGLKQADRTRTSLFAIPPTLAEGSEDHVVEMKGPLNTAATLSENLLLEYTEGLKAKDVGWGCVDGAKLRSMIDLHTAAFDLVQRTPAVASIQAKGLLRVVRNSIEQAALQKKVEGAEGDTHIKALYLVGHDTNLANLAGLLRAEWIADGRRNDTPPGSSLSFELWKGAGNTGFEIRAFFTTQTLEQIREARALTATEQPAKVPVYLPGCSRATAACPLDDFLSMMNALQPR